MNMEKAEGWSGILVYVQLARGQPTPEALELMAAGRKLAVQRGCTLSAVSAGMLKDFEGSDSINIKSKKGLWNTEHIYFYSLTENCGFCEDIYAGACKDCIMQLRPEVVLFGSTVEEKSIAALCAASFETGLTADCTDLTFSPEGLLIQTRPAFGGSLMADIITPVRRPVMATVRPGILSEEVFFGIQYAADVCIKAWHQKSAFHILKNTILDKKEGIEHADVVVAIGGGVKRKEDVTAFAEFARKLGAELAGSRTLVDRGWLSVQVQIGLSGKSIAPRLLICLGISGSVQFCAGIRNAPYIVAVNEDAQARICSVAHLYYVGDMYTLLALAG